jgi:hypothetical protein
MKQLIIGERMSRRAPYQAELDRMQSHDGYTLFAEGERFIIYKKTEAE